MPLVRTVVALCAAVLAMLAVAGPAHAELPVIGIGEQHTPMFSDPAFLRLDLENVRYVVAWDALEHPDQTQEIDDYLTAARDAGISVLVGFGHSRDPKLAHKLPTLAQFRRQFLAFHARYPWVKEYITWNETNQCGQPTCNHPEAAAKFYLTIRQHCHGCTIIGADVLDGSRLAPWVRRFQKAVGNRRVLWGLHNYIDANRFRERGTKAMLNAVKGDIWFTETGGLVVRRNGSTIAFPGSVPHAARATKYIFKLAALSPRIKRVYFYHWEEPAAPNATWDSGLMDKHDKPRPAYDVLLQWLIHHGIAPSFSPLPS